MSSSPTLAENVADLLESDCRYFEQAARVAHLEGATLAWMPGLSGIAAGCVVHRIDWTERICPGQWVEQVEHRLEELSPFYRIYLQGPIPELETVLRAHGYRERTEIGYLAVKPLLPKRAGVALRPVEDARDWSLKLRLHQESGQGPDGYETPAEQWVRLERAKAEQGYLRCFFITRDGEVCGALGLAQVGSVLRLKNVLVHPAYRRQGIATEAVRQAGGLAAQLGKSFGCFAVAGELGERVYRRIGMQPCTAQTEWLRRAA